MTPIRFLSPAEREMAVAASYYESCSHNLGRRFLEQVRSTVKLIRQHPHGGILLREEIRRRLVRRFPFAVLYRIDPDEIVIVAVMDLRRDPDYWIHRV